MPIYEFICSNCKKRFEKRFSFSEYGLQPVSCPYCHGTSVQRKIGRIRVSKSEESRFDEMSDFSSLDGLEEDPKSMGRMLRKMKSNIGQEVSPEFDDVVSRLETGQTPQEIEKDLPDLGNHLPGGGIEGPQDGDEDY